MKDINTYYLRLNKGCIPVQGARRSLLCDLYQERYLLIGPELFEILAVHYRKSIAEICSIYPAGRQEMILDAFGMLEQQGWIFYSKDAGPDAAVTGTWWVSTAQITNALFDCDRLPDYITPAFVADLGRLGCRHLQFRFFKPVDLHRFLQQTVAVLDHSAVVSVSLLLPCMADTGNWRKALQQNTRIQEIVFWEATAARSVQAGHPVSCRIQYSTATISSSMHCGVVHAAYFTVNEAHYRESHMHNSCLYRKISIDTEGNIKNCPSMKESFGNIKDTSLAEALQQPGFRQYWDITKNQVMVCRDCEFRHICTDCRAYREDPEDQYSKPLKCGYDPYTGTWEEWSRHPLKQQAIAFYGMEALRKE